MTMLMKITIERTAPKEKELTDEQLAAKAAARKAKKTRQRERRAKEAERAASEAERAERPRAQLRANIEYVMEGLRSAAARARSQAGSKTRVTYSLPPERDDGYRRGPSVMCATVPQGTVATTVAQDWLANELAEYGVLLEELLQLLGPHASRCSRGRGGGRLARLGLLGRLRRRLRFPFAARGVLRAPPLFEEADQRGFFLPSRSRDAALVAHLLQVAQPAGAELQTLEVPRDSCRVSRHRRSRALRDSSGWRSAPLLSSAPLKALVVAFFTTNDCTTPVLAKAAPSGPLTMRASDNGGARPSRDAASSRPERL